MASFSAMPLWKKALVIVGLPLVILYFILRAAGSISQIFNDAARKKTDEEANRLDSEIQKTKEEVAKSEGKVEQLESDREKAVEATKNDDPIDFHNNRKK